MNQFLIRAKILENVEVGTNVLRLTFEAEEIAETAKSGQFLMVKTATEASDDPILRRPFSIHRVDGKRVCILYKVVGRGTTILAKQQKVIDLVGPLGNGFSIPEEGRLAIVGGGLGIAPLLFVAQQALRQGREEEEIQILIGARTSAEFPVVDDFRQLGLKVRTATDDGSAGHHGLVTELMDMEGDWTVLTCGPAPMMRAVAKRCEEKNWDCQVSLETTMPCGMGACLGCAVQGKEKHEYKHVCKDGPVFKAGDVCL
ncbi:MAG TPA: dihydroorotate dehydrogenase electron transfer subunit [Desulfobacterales bacterium]|nr:dihydroorotate dehydrogenase electron transfer subunit [Desulfobacterales bacterium]